MREMERMGKSDYWLDGITRERMEEIGEGGEDEEGVLEKVRESWSESWSEATIRTSYHTASLHEIPSARRVAPRTYCLLT